jgi:hypothetical protein
VFQASLDLRLYSRYQHQPDPQAIEQGDIVDEAWEAFVHHCPTTKADHEGLTPMRMDVG